MTQAQLIAKARELANSEPSPEVRPPKCQCDKHKTPCQQTADYLVTLSDHRIAVDDRCTLTGDEDRDLYPDWAKFAAAAPTTPEAPREPLHVERVRPVEFTGEPQPIRKMSRDELAKLYPPRVSMPAIGSRWRYQWQYEAGGGWVDTANHMTVKSIDGDRAAFVEGGSLPFAAFTDSGKPGATEGRRYRMILAPATACRLGAACHAHNKLVREPYISAVDDWDLLPDV